MSQFKVTKQIDFCYGHRLLNYDGKCKHLHGHNGLIEIEVASDSLDSRGMVVDFGDVKDVVKGWVDEHMDHKMILCKDDPILGLLTDIHEPVYVMDENPTAENIAMHIHRQALKAGLDILETRLWETPSSFAAYSSISGSAGGAGVDRE
ncbi:MAG: 6-carboxytetrahydropterin synthase [Chloroflexi bacterium]|nr:6-carboxytetrahydropterin synthase [Chloroflexota bacterium]